MSTETWTVVHLLGQLGEDRIWLHCRGLPRKLRGLSARARPSIQGCRCRLFGIGALIFGSHKLPDAQPHSKCQEDEVQIPKEGETKVLRLALFHGHVPRCKEEHQVES